jgi:hypothetical protein
MFLAAARSGWLPPLEPWMIHLVAFGLLLFGFLALASFFSALFRIAPVHRWAVTWWNLRRQQQAAEDYIQYMTDREKEIIAFLLAKNQKMFDAEIDGGYAAPLLSRGIVRIIMVQGQHADHDRVPMAIPDHIWDVLVRNRDKFRYAPPPQGKVEPYPWRIPWQLQ